MKFAFRPLARQIYQSITPAQLLDPSETTGCAKQTTQRLADSLQLDFMEQFFKAGKEKAQAAFVWATQSCMVNLADKLQSYIAQINQMPLHKTTQEECIAFYTTIEEQLLYLLGFLQTSFGCYCNTEQKLPDYDIVHMQPYFLQSVKSLEKQIARGISPQLIQLITEPLKKYYNPGGNCQLNYGMYAYWKTLLDQLQSQAGTGNNGCIETLILCNFNHGSFINQVVETWQQTIHQLENTTEKKEQWATHLRAINRLHPVPGMQLYKNAPTCKQSLLHAIEAEITVHNTQENPILCNIPPYTHSPIQPFQTTLSVPQLAGMVRLMVDTGILTCDNQVSLLKNVSRNFTTRKQKEISPESLRQKYYNQDIATISILKTHLTNMMGRLSAY